MRNFTLLTIAVCSMALTSNAQINKGTVLLGGNISAYNRNSNNAGNPNYAETDGFHVAPSVGFVTATNSAWGFNLSYSNSRTKYAAPNTNNKNEGHGYGGGVFYRRYVSLGKGFYLFGQAGAGYNYGKQHAEVSNVNGFSTTTRTNTVYLNAYPGITYTVSKNFHLEIGLNDLLNLSYGSSKTSNIGISGSSNQRNFSFATNLSISNPFNVGFRFALGK